MLDTDVLIAALDRGDTHHRRAAEAIADMIERGFDLLLSTINYAEALVRPAEHEKTMQAAVDAIAALGIRPVAPTAAIARDAARYRSLGVSLADGFALATARARSASVASFDSRVRRAMSELEIEAPEQLT
ncbi:MAG: PIN domain-containing protein [Solirubrobacterales bacterium]